MKIGRDYDQMQWLESMQSRLTKTNCNFCAGHADESADKHASMTKVGIRRAMGRADILNILRKVRQEKDVKF